VGRPTWGEVEFSRHPGAFLIADQLVRRSAISLVWMAPLLSQNETLCTPGTLRIDPFEASSTRFGTCGPLSDQRGSHNSFPRAASLVARVLLLLLSVCEENEELTCEELLLVRPLDEDIVEERLRSS
jgi:hypothetical protein